MSSFIIVGDKIFCCGSNNHGQLGLGDCKNRGTFTQVPGGIFLMVSHRDDHTCAIDKDLCLWSCGNNSFGQLGLGHSKNTKIFTKVAEDKFISVACGSFYTAVIDETGYLWICGMIWFDQFNPR